MRIPVNPRFFTSSVLLTHYCMPRSAITLTAHVLIFYPFDGPEVQLDCPKLGPTVWTSAGGVGAWFERVLLVSI